MKVGVLQPLIHNGSAAVRNRKFISDQVNLLRAAGVKEAINLDDAHTAVTIEKPTRAADHHHDGNILGALGIFSAMHAAEEVEPILPNNGAPVSAAVILINGIMTDVALQQRDMQGLANTGCSVVGIHNATRGMSRDLLECVQNKLRRGDTPAIDTLARFIAIALDEGRPLRLIGHSQGALICARALQIVDEAMGAGGMSAAERKAALATISVETYGGAAQSYIDGPKYVHVLNSYDLVPMFTGVGLNALNPFGHVGDGAEVHRFRRLHSPGPSDEKDGGVIWNFARTIDQTTHGPRAIYWRFRNGNKNDEG